ncbi:GTPase domain-containing protein [Actinophytocola sp.]|uniref:GTPase domain-containing protein n=1 Tax=Actinophytocola sp. TaxID=1872138 RepID=UPI002ED3671E
MPIFIPVLIAGFSVASAAILKRQLRKPLRLVVLGQRTTGKSLLINSWQGEWATPPATNTPVKITPIRIDTGEKVLNIEKKFIFKTFHDISGRDEPITTNGNELDRAEAVLYLVKATTLFDEERRTAGHGQHTEWVRVQLDAARLADRATAARRVVIVVTHADLDPRSDTLPWERYCDHVAKQLAHVCAAIGPPDKTRVVVGSLADPERAATLTNDIIGSLL